MISPLDKPKLSRLYRLQWEEAQDNYVLLYPEGMVKLNQSAAEILKRCDGERDVAAGHPDQVIGGVDVVP